MISVSLIIVTSILSAQETGRRTIFLKSGERLDGEVVKRSEEHLVLKVEEEEKRVPLKSVKGEMSRKTADSMTEMLKLLGSDYEWWVTDSPSMVAVFPKSSDWQQRINSLRGFFSYLAKLFSVEFEYEPLIVIASPNDAKGKLDLTHYGYYDDSTMRLFIRSDSGDTVLKHEAVHLFHLEHSKKNGLPQALWVIEGLAALFENATLECGRVKPPPANRSEETRKLFSFDALPKLTDFIEQDFSAFYQNPAENYSLASCLLNFVYKKNLLEKFLKEYSKTCKDDRGGTKALEKVFEKKMEEIETEFHLFIKSLPRPSDLPPVDSPFIGVETQEIDKRLRIAKVIRNSPAERSGFKVGDILISLNGVYVKSFDNLRRILSSCKSGDRLKFILLRDDSIFEGEVTTNGVRD
ncbi:MAG: PDZ domain-containing protein [Planctomycetota bacterium]|nr:PDZ domain-containing protein [Planctomycetota bacterium]